MYKLQTLLISHERRAHKEEDLLCEEIILLRSICGQVNWFSSHSRPDLAFDVCNISCSISVLLGMEMFKEYEISEKSTVRES